PRSRAPSPRSSGTCPCRGCGVSGTRGPQSPTVTDPPPPARSSFPCSSTAPHEVHELERVAGLHFCIVVIFAVQDLTVVLDDDEPRMQPERIEHGTHGAACSHRTCIAVDRDRNHGCHACSCPRSPVYAVRIASRYVATAIPTSSALQTPLNTATPQAPATAASRTRAGVTPPIAMTGAPAWSAAVRSAASPAGALPGCDRVSQILPRITKSAPALTAAPASSGACAE